MEPISPDAIDPPSNVLLVHPARHRPGACRRLRRPADETAEIRVSFSTDQSATVDGGADAPSKVGLVSVGDVLRSASADAEPDFAAPMAVDAIEDPGDCSAIGVSVSRFCERWSGCDERIVLCFRSLDALLRHASPKTVFQFVHVLTNRLKSVDAVAHFHLDPSAHDDRIVSTFGSIFDDVVADDSVRGSLPEASDEDVAQVLAEWADGEGDDDRRRSDRNGLSEATDEEVARSLNE